MLSHRAPSFSSALVAAVLLALFLPQAYDLKLPEHENVILAPPLMMSVAYLTGELITLGNDAPSALKNSNHHCSACLGDYSLREPRIY